MGLESNKSINKYGRSKENELTKARRLFQFLTLQFGSWVLAGFVLFVFAARNLNAQHFTFSHYGQDEGLRNLDVFQVIQDKTGLLWVATENGLFRYDGSEFHHFGPKDGIQETLIFSLFQDDSGRIWVTTNDHIYFFSGTRFESVDTGPAAIHFGVGQRFTSIDSQHILFIDHGSLMLVQQADQHNQWAVKPFFSRDQSASRPELSQVGSIFVGPDRVLWLGCGNAICRVKNSQVEVMGQARGVPPEPWLYFYADRKGGIWARSFRHIRLLDPGASQFVARDISRDHLSTYAGAGQLTFAEDSQGNVLTQTDTGIARWNAGPGAWQTFDRSNGLAFTAISTILRDRQGSIWIGTRGHGLYRWLGYGEVENWTVVQGLHSDIVWSTFRDGEHRLWIADQYQVTQLDEAGRRATAAPALTMPEFHQGDGFAQSQNGDLWIGYANGNLIRFNPATQRITFRGRLPNILRLFQDSSNRLWICTTDGIYVIRSSEANPAAEKIEDPLVLNDAFADAAEDSSNNLWFISDGHLYRLARGVWSKIVVDQRVTRGQMRGIAAAPDGTLWIGGGLPGLLHLRVTADRAEILNFVTPPEIASNDIQIVRFDQRGWLWIGTDLGVNVFDGTNWKLLTNQQGLISNDTNEGAFFAESDGSIWIGVNGGDVHLLHPEHLFTQSTLQLSLKSATLGDRVIHLDGKKNIWRWLRAPLDISFTSLNYDRRGSLRFRYRLIGLEPAWSQTSENHLHYPAMPPGDYRFEVQAIDPNQHAQSEVRSFNFTIRPPWWRTQAAYFLIACLALFSARLLWHWRMHRLVNRQQILKHLIAQRTRELEAEKAELVAAREALRQQATRDSLTGLWNRSAIFDILERQMDRARREGSTLAVVLADIDHFKKINDTLGHLAGDSILRDAAQRMLDNVRPYDLIGRYGGEEFLIIFPGLPVLDPLSRLVQLQKTISAKPFEYDGRSIAVTSSFGAVWMDMPNMTVEDMFRCADEALYKAKASGRDCIIYYTHPTTDDMPT